MFGSEHMITILRGMAGQQIDNLEEMPSGSGRNRLLWQLCKFA